MSKYIDADELKKVFRDEEDAEYTRWTLAGVIGEIDDIEAADVVEVVRCRECKYREDEQPSMVYCQNTVGGWVDENWFCADGARDVAEVWRGRWIPTLIMGDRGSAGYTCSVCHKFNKTDNNYCPNCGARMGEIEE